MMKTIQLLQEKTHHNKGRLLLLYVFFIATVFVPIIAIFTIVTKISQSSLPYHKSGNIEEGSRLSLRSLHSTKKSSEKNQDDMESIHDTISQQINSDNIRKNSQYYSKYPHPPGSDRNEILAKKMSKQWKAYGFDKTDLYKYKVLLSYPKKPAEIHLKDNDHHLKKLVIKNEPAFGRSERNGEPIYPYNAFSVSGNVKGEIVYVNYGREEDIKLLQKLNVRLNERIFLIRYGTSHSRSTIIKTAKENGALGVIFYSDPYDYTDPGEEYPKGWMLNKYGVQRGTIYEVEGDPLSIGYPSKEHYFRNKPSDVTFLTEIPSQPVSWETAEQIFRFMNDDSVALISSFKGSLNVTYSLQSATGRMVSLIVQNEVVDRNTYVACGSLFGRAEPDRYVILGNHRDAWIYGASDPVSGSAVMTEIVRVLGKSRKQLRYRPRRSIMVCSWGAEESSMMGSTEWADEMANFINNKVVAYLNVDTAVEGNWTIQIKSLDHMIGSIFQASKQVACPENETINLFQDMCHKHALLKHQEVDLVHPDYGPPGGVSDHKRMHQRYGVTVSDYRYTYSQLDFPRLTAHNGNYHTLYDSFDWMERFVDPTFEHHATLGKLWLRHALLLVDEVLIPINLEAYARQIRDDFTKFKSEHSAGLERYDVSLSFANGRLNALIKACKKFHNTINKMKDRLKDSQIRALNDRIMHFEKHFILRSEVGVQSLKHIIYKPAGKFYGILSALEENPGENGANIQREVTLFIWCVDMAVRSLDLSELRI